MQERTWPIGAQYQEAIQNNSVTLKDIELRQGIVERDSHSRLPIAYSGGSAAVFVLKSGNKMYAVRCFLKDDKNDPTRVFRYSRIAEFINSESSSYWAKFDFLTEEILIKGRRFPLLKMEWVNGPTLADFIEDNLDNRDALLRIGSEFLSLVKSLQQTGVAHGDLQHGNIIVSDGKIRLIDYDDIYISSLHAEPGVGIGHPNYNHPLRQRVHYGPKVDHFSSIVIYLSILAVATKPSLWEKFNDGDNLLLKKKDYIDPYRSLCFQEMANIENETVFKLNEILAEICRIDPSTTPSLSDLLDKERQKEIVLGPPVKLPGPEPQTPKTPTMVFPNLTSILLPGNGYEIIWDSSEFAGQIKLELISNRRQTEELARAPSMLGSIYWRVPKFQPGGNSYRIAIRSLPSKEILEISQPFTILSNKWQYAFDAFKKYDCSWCGKFYTTQPWMCYYRKIKLDQCITFGRRPPCKFFSKISESRRQEAFLDERWWWLIFDEITSAHLIDDYREGKNKEVYKTSVDNSHGKETEISLKICPNCSKKSIWKNYSTQLLECLNHNCKRKFTEKEYILALQTRGR